jgi:capsular polysaccharide biosynthesis protein
MVLMTFGICFVIGGLLVAIRHNEYKSVAMVEAGSFIGQAYDDHFYPEQFALIQSDTILTNVIAKLKLNEAWGEKYNRGRRLSDAQVKKMLNRQLDLVFVNNTRFLKISVYDRDPNEAAVLGNAIAETYSEYRTQELRRLVAADRHPHYEGEHVGAVIMDRAVAGLKPVRPNPHLAGLMMLVGTLLTIAGIVRRNSARISSYFAEMYREDR